MDGEARKGEGPSQTNWREMPKTRGISSTPTIHQEVTIRKVTNGFIIHVGCKTFVSTRWGEVALGLGEYWTDPNAAERKYIVHENSIKMGKEIVDGLDGPF